MSVVLDTRTGGTGHKQERRRFPLNTRDCAVQVTEHRHRLPRDILESPPEIFSSCLDVGLGTLLWVILLQQALGQVDPEVPDNLNHSVLP